MEIVTSEFYEQRRAEHEKRLRDEEKKHALILALRRNYNLPSFACREVGVTYLQYLEFLEDEEFAQSVELLALELEERVKKVLFDKILIDEDVSAAKFFIQSNESFKKQNSSARSDDLDEIDEESRVKIFEAALKEIQICDEIRRAK